MVIVQRNGEKNMELKIYKGFDIPFLKQLDDSPLIENSLESKKNVLLFDTKTKKQLDIALLELDDDKSAWITYEEYTLIKTRIEEAIKDYDLKVTIYKIISIQIIILYHLN